VAVLGLPSSISNKCETEQSGRFLPEPWRPSRRPRWIPYTVIYVLRYLFIDRALHTRTFGIYSTTIYVMMSATPKTFFQVSTICCIHLGYAVTCIWYMDLAYPPIVATALKTSAPCSALERGAASTDRMEGCLGHNQVVVSVQAV
jgi:hypothetical protein